VIGASLGCVLQGFLFIVFLKKTLAEKKDTMEELARSQPMEVKTIDNMRLSLLAI
jgi:hypothetical protein